MSARAPERLRRLQYRSDYTGTRETDLLLGGFARQHLASLNVRQLGDYESLLAIEDPRLYKWISGMEEPPERYQTDVLALIRNFSFKA